MTYEDVQALLNNDTTSLAGNSLPAGLYNQLQSLQQQQQNTRGTGQQIAPDLNLNPKFRRFALNANPLQTQAAPLSPLQSMPLPPEHYPQFLNPLQQKMAEASGLVNPHYSDPRAELEHHLNLQIQNNNEAFDTQQNAEYFRRAQMAHSAYAPQLDSSGKLSNPEQFLSTQTAGDRTGTVSQILRSLQGGGTGQTPLQPYLPEAGFGKRDSDQSLLNPLDHTIYNDPAFQQTLVRDPERAAFAYQQLTGRALDSDYKAHKDFQKKQMDTGYGYAADAIKQGAVFDPTRQAWKVWNSAPDSGDQSLSFQTPKPFRQLVDATEQQNKWLNMHHKNVTGYDLPAAPPAAPKSAQMDAQRHLKDPVIKASVEATQTKLGRTLTPQEIQVQAALTKQDAANVAAHQAQQTQANWNIIPHTADALMGFKPTDWLNQPAIDRYFPQEDGSNLNWWGKMLHGNPAPSADAYPMINQ